MAALDEGYGLRMDRLREAQYPSALPSSLPPRDTTPPQIPQELLGQMQPASPTLDKKFPDVVLERQGQGPKLDRAALDNIREQYRVEKVTPWAAGQKGADKDYIAAQEAAYLSRANDWIEKYLAEGGQLTETTTAGTADTGSGEGFGLKRFAQGMLQDIPVATGRAVLDLIPGIIDAGVDYFKGGANTQAQINSATADWLTGKKSFLEAAKSAFIGANQGVIANVAGAKKLVESDKPLSVAVADALGVRGDIAGANELRNKVLGYETPIEQGTAFYRKGTNALREELTSQATLDAERGMGEVLDDDSKSVGDLAAYVLANPSALAGVTGDVIGQMVPAVLTGGATAGATAAANANKVQKLGWLAQKIAGAARNVPAVAATAIPAVGNDLARLRQNIDSAPLAELTTSQNNKELYDFYRTQLGMPEAEAEKALRQTLYAKSADITRAGSAAANLVGPLATGAPLERAAATLGGRVAAEGQKGLLRRTTGGAVRGAAEEAAESLPQNISENLAAGQVSGAAQVNPLENVAKQALIDAIGGGGAGAALNIRNPLRRPAATPTPTTETTEVGAPPPLPPIPGEVAPAAAAAQAAPGAGLEEAEHKKTLKTVTTAAKAARDIKDVLKDSTNAEEFIGGVQAFLEEEIPDTWTRMDATQRLAATEAVAGEFIRAVKNDDIKTAITGRLAESRTALTTEATPPHIPAASVVEPTAPEPPALPVVEPPVAATPAPAPTTSQKSLRAPKTEAPTPAIPPEQKAAEDAEVIRLDTAPEPASATLPADLKGAKPTYGLVPLTFDSDIDRAAYGSTGKAGDRYKAWLKTQGLSEQDITTLREQIKAKLKAGVKDNQKPATTAEGKIKSVRITPTYKTVTVSTPKAATKPLKKSKEVEQAEKEAAAQDEADKAKKKVDALKKAASKAKATKETKAKPLKAETPPKSEAPAAQPGPVVAQTAPTTETPTTARETPEQAVSRVAPDLEGADRTNVVEAVRVARESGDTKELNDVLRDVEATAEQKKAIREAAKHTTPKEEGLTETKSAEMPTTFAAPLDAYAYARDNNLGAKGLIEGLRRTKGIEAWHTNILDKIASILEKGNVTLRDFTPEEIAAAEKRGVKKENIGGVFRMGDNSIAITNGDPTTAIHELLHAATSHALAQETDDPKITKLQEELDNLRLYVRTYIRNNPELVQFNKERLKKETGPLGNTRELLAYGLTDTHTMMLLSKIPAPPDSKLSTAWQEFVRIVADFFGVKPGDRTAFNDLVDISGRLLDILAADPEELNRARLRVVLGKTALTADSQPFEFAELAQVPPVAASNPPKTKVAHASRPIFAMDRVWELFNNAQLGLERAMQEVSRAGGKLSDETNLVHAWRRYTSWMNETRGQDTREVIEPIGNWITNNMDRFGETDPDSFRKHLDQFLQDNHMLTERIPSIWAETVKLKNGQEVKRALILRKAKSGVISGEEMNRQLIALAKKNAAVDMDTWAKSNARDTGTLNASLAKLAKLGYTQANLKDLNALLTGLRDRERHRRVQSGTVDPKDPFASRGWKWYVPLKGNLAVSEAMADHDVGASKGATRAFRSGNLKTIQGRKNIADNAIEQMATDMHAAVASAADKQLKEIVFKFARQNKKITGMAVRTFEGNPKDGYTTEQGWVKPRPGKPPKFTNRNKKTRRKILPNPENGFVLHDGDTHYEVQFPDNSLIMRGLKGKKHEKGPHHISNLGNTLENDPDALGKAFRALGTVTNIKARLQTTWHPVWTAMVAAARDTNALPLTVAAEVFDSPLQAAGFFGNYAKGLFSNYAQAVRHWKGDWDIINGNETSLAAYAAKNPSSFPAKVLEYRKNGGSTEYAQSFNKEAANESLFGKLQRRKAGDIGKAWNKTKDGFNKWNEVTSNWAQVLELKARVAAYEALISQGKEPKTAAAIVKGALDFGQSGEVGKLLNAMHTYYRVGATGMDVIRRISTDKDGFFDYKKAAKWGPFVAGLGYAQYMLLAAALGFEDDEQDEDGNPVPKIHKYSIDTLTRNMLVPDGEGGVIKYPLGLGLPQLLSAPGTIAAAIQNGAITPKEGVEAYYKVVTRNYPAIQPEGRAPESGPAGYVSSWLKALLPSITKPLTELDDNLNTFDRPIHNDFKQDKRPAALQGRSTTADEFKDMAKGLHRATNGAIDMYPESIRHIITQYGGQPVNELLQWTIERDRKEQQGLGETTPIQALKAGAEDPKFYYSNESYKAIAKLRAAERQLAFHKEADEDEGKAWINENKNVARRVEAMKPLAKAQKVYYEDLANIRKDKLMSAEGKQLARKRADSKLREAVNAANKVINETED